MSSEAGIAVVRRNTEEVQSRGNFEVFEELFASDFVDHTPQPGLHPGPRRRSKLLRRPSRRKPLHKETVMIVEPYLFFEGRCEEALDFYHKALGAEVTALMRFKESPDPNMCPAGAEDKVITRHGPHRQHHDNGFRWHELRAFSLPRLFDVAVIG